MVEVSPWQDACSGDACDASGGSHLPPVPESASSGPAVAFAGDRDLECAVPEGRDNREEVQDETVLAMSVPVGVAAKCLDSAVDSNAMGSEATFGSGCHVEDPSMQPTALEPAANPERAAHRIVDSIGELDGIENAPHTDNDIEDPLLQPSDSAPDANPKCVAHTSVDSDTLGDLRQSTPEVDVFMVEVSPWQDACSGDACDASGGSHLPPVPESASSGPAVAFAGDRDLECAVPEGRDNREEVQDETVLAMSVPVGVAAKCLDSAVDSNAMGSEATFGSGCHVEDPSMQPTALEPAANPECVAHRIVDSVGELDGIEDAPHTDNDIEDPLFQPSASDHGGGSEGLPFSGELQTTVPSVLLSEACQDPSNAIGDLTRSHVGSGHAMRYDDAIESNDTRGTCATGSGKTVDVGDVTLGRNASPRVAPIVPAQRDVVPVAGVMPQPTIPLAAPPPIVAEVQEEVGAAEASHGTAGEEAGASPPNTPRSRIPVGVAAHDVIIAQVALDTPTNVDAALVDATVAPFELSSTDNGDTTADAYRLMIKSIFQKHNPNCAGDLDPILQRYKGNERKLYVALCRKYDITPSEDAASLTSAADLMHWPVQQSEVFSTMDGEGGLVTAKAHGAEVEMTNADAPREDRVEKHDEVEADVALVSPKEPQNLETKSEATVETESTRNEEARPWQEEKYEANDEPTDVDHGEELLVPEVGNIEYTFHERERKGRIEAMEQVEAHSDGKQTTAKEQGRQQEAMRVDRVEDTVDDEHMNALVTKLRSCSREEGRALLKSLAPAMRKALVQRTAAANAAVNRSSAVSTPALGAPLAACADTKPETPSTTTAAGAASGAAEAGNLIAPSDALAFPGVGEQLPAAAATNSGGPNDETCGVVAQASCSSVGPQVIEDECELYRERIAAVYREHNPDKLSEVDGLLLKYQGREQELYFAICRKYKVPVSGGGGDEVGMSAAHACDEASVAGSLSSWFQTSSSAVSGTGGGLFQTLNTVKNVAEGLKKNVEQQFNEAVLSQEDGSALDAVHELRDAVENAAAATYASGASGTGVPDVATSVAEGAGVSRGGDGVSVEVSQTVLRELDVVRAERDSLKAERRSLVAERSGLIEEGTSISKRMHAMEARMKEMVADARRSQERFSELERAKTTLEAKAAKIASRTASAEALADDRLSEVRRLQADLNKTRSQIQAEQRQHAEESRLAEMQTSKMKQLEERMQEQLDASVRDRAELMDTNNALSTSLQQARIVADSAECSLELARAEAMRHAEEQRTRIAEIELEFARQSLPYARQISTLEARLSRQEEAFREREIAAKRATEEAEAQLAAALEKLQAAELVNKREAEVRQAEVAEAWSARECSDERRELAEKNLRLEAERRQVAEQRTATLTERVQELSQLLAQQKAAAPLPEQQGKAQLLEGEGRRLRTEVELLKKQRDEITQQNSQLQKEVESLRWEARKSSRNSVPDSGGELDGVLLQRKFEAALQMIGLLQEELDSCREKLDASESQQSATQQP